MNIKQIKLELAKLIGKFEEIPTDKVTLIIDGDELKQGDAVYISENDELIPAADDTYTLEDGKVVVVVGGIVESINEKTVDEVPAEPVEDVVEVKAEDIPNTEVETDGIEETTTDALDAIHKEINDLYAIVNALSKKIETMSSKTETTMAKVEKMSKQSVDEPIKNEPDVTLCDEVMGRKLKNFGI